MVNIFFYLLVKGRLFEVKEFFLEDILKLIGFRKKEAMNYDEEAHKGKQLFSVCPWMFPPVFIVFVFVHYLIWFSAKKRQKSLTEWCETVKKRSGEEEEGTSVLSHVPEDSGVSDREDGAFNRAVE